MCAALVALLLLGMAFGLWANFVPGEGPHRRNETASMTFDEPFAFVTNAPHSQQHLSGPVNMPAAYSTNKYVTERRLPPWLHSVDGGATTIRTNAHNYLMEDTWRGFPSLVDWVTNPAIGAGALRLATTSEVCSASGRTGVSDSVSYNMLPAVISNQSWFAASARASIVLHVCVPDPSVWQVASYPFLFMSMVDDGPGGPWGEDWPAVYCKTNGAAYTWACDAGETNAYWENDYTVYPHMQITGPGWWTVGISMDEDGGVNYYVRSGLVTLSGEDYCGSYRPVVFTRCYGLAGTFYVGNMTMTMSPGWIVDGVDYFHDLPRIPGGTVIRGR